VHAPLPTIVRRLSPFFAALVIAAISVDPHRVSAQGLQGDYTRARGLSEELSGLAVGIPGNAEWLEGAHEFWYRVSVPGGSSFIRVDADAAMRAPAFDHQRLADAVSLASGEEYTAVTLPFSSFDPVGAFDAIEFRAEGRDWRCDLGNYRCSEVAEPTVGGRGGGRGAGPGGGGGRGGGRGGGATNAPSEGVRSPDGEWDALVRNYNVVIRQVGSSEMTVLSTDGSEGDSYREGDFEWSPDSEKLAAYRVKPGFERRVHYVESSPEDQVQPRYSNRVYLKPGDVLEVETPVLFEIETGTQVVVDRALFPNAYSQTGIQWWDDSRGFYFGYNQRGHEVYRVIEVDAGTGQARALVDETPETFFSYYTTLYQRVVEDSNEIIWASERDGWRHLYLYDAVSGTVKNQITEGDWVVREIDFVDEENRQIWFRASGMHADQDPYFMHYFRVDFDGSNLTAFTDEDGTHSASWSADREFYVDTWSRADAAPTSVLRRTRDQQVVMELERADVSALEAEGWHAPEPFVAKGRDGTTDIWGVIIRPTDFDPSRSYPVIEYIYAGPHDSFVPKAFQATNSMMAQAELGFIVVQIDGMGTANRSKAFHDVAWKNIKDAGFPDRILWHEAVAERFSWYDVTRVGIYGTSAGGQNSLGALLFFPEFYDVAVSAAGCHDNRMDKISWNEQWMSWPVGPQYAESSNVDNAWRLQGKVLLVVGELDTNVDPSSTYQVADALIDADKDFDLLVLPGAGHTAGGAYGERKRWDYFVEHLLGVDPPHWNAISAEAGSGGS